jgi:hypothetical protein
MNKSPERGTFHSQCRIEDVIAEGRDPATDEDVQSALELERMINDHSAQRETDERWRENNLEYDLRSTKWICDKAKAREEYAQNLYAALCNNDFQKLEVWPLLKGETYSCSWRYAGGIIADMLETGDYIDWYCSGIRGGAVLDAAELTDEQRAKIEWYDKHFVGESVVTDEICEDLKKLGWKVIEEEDDNI